MSKEYDFVVFGASGFTGKYVCKELVKQSYGRGMKIAFSGRNQKKLEEVLQWTQRDQSDVDVGLIIADVEDEQSLLNMCKQSKVILDCVGPYRLWGEQVVKACVEAASDYIDISGEPEYMERIRLKYHDAATAKGIYIVSACGFDCIPSELGIIYAKQQFSGTLATVENYFTMHHGKDGMTGNYGTYASLVLGISEAKSLRDTRKRTAGKSVLPLCGSKLKSRGLHYSSTQGAYALPFFGADVSVVRRSQRYYFDQFQEIPAQFSMYYCTTFMQMLSILLFVLVLRLMTSFSLGKRLLLRYPSFFTAGAFSKDGPSEKQMAESGMEFKMYCRGYKSTISVDEFQSGCSVNKPCDLEMMVEITGPEIGYVLTPITMVQSAFTMMEERCKLPSTGGVYSPGPVFKQTTIINRLQQNGIKFNVLRQME